MRENPTSQALFIIRVGVPYWQNAIKRSENNHDNDKLRRPGRTQIRLSRYGHAIRSYARSHTDRRCGTVSR